MEVFLTGATGFVGGHVLRALLDAGHSVRALVRERPRSLRHAAAPALLDLPGCAVVPGDLRRPGELVDALRGCDALIHVAALYSFSPADRADLRAVNVAGTTGILEAARLAGVRRAVVTSSSSTVGPARGNHLATEDDWAAPEGHSAYHTSKILQERAALAARLGAVVLLPTAPVGPGDARPTPTGAMVLDVLRGRIKGTVAGGGLNLVAVEDVARAHVAALRSGEPRERYLLGGENLTLSEVFTLLAELCGRRPPRLRIPHPVALAAGIADELRCRVLADARPLVPLEGVRMSRHRMWIDDSRARRELAHTSSPVRDALARAVEWYSVHRLAA